MIPNDQLSRFQRPTRTVPALVSKFVLLHINVITRASATAKTPAVVHVVLTLEAASSAVALDAAPLSVAVAFSLPVAFPPPGASTVAIRPSRAISTGLCVPMYATRTSSWVSSVMKSSNGTKKLSPPSQGIQHNLCTTGGTRRRCSPPARKSSVTMLYFASRSKPLLPTVTFTSFDPLLFAGL